MEGVLCQDCKQLSDVIDMLSNINPQTTGPILSIGSLYLQGNILNYLGKNTDEDLSLLPKQ